VEMGRLGLAVDHVLDEGAAVRGGEQILAGMPDHRCRLAGRRTSHRLLAKPSGIA